MAFLRTLLLLALATSPLLAGPNVIFILADDLGYGDLSLLGQEKFQTPNIDRLGKEGIVLTNHYSGNTVCSPSRANLMTGQHPGNVYCRQNANEKDLGLDPAMTVLPEVFKSAGYATGCFGKWGLGITNARGPQNPLTHGFDSFTGWKSQRIAHTYYPTSIVRDGKEEKLPAGTYIHDLIMEDAMAFVKRHGREGTPFFCYIPTAIPHAAMHAPAGLHEKWRKKFPRFDRKIGRYGAGPDEPCPDVVNPIAGFAAMMEHLDNNVGDLLALLAETGIDDNTLIIFSSDNGTHLEGGHDPGFWNSNGPFRGHKRDFYEGGIHAPFLARWPGTIKAGSTSPHLSAFWDYLATAADLTGQEVPAQSDGLSFLPTLLGKPGEQEKHEFLYWETKEGGSLKRAVRLGDWKGLSLRRNGKQVFELYNLEKDPGETTNVADQHPDLVTRIRGIMKEAHTPLK